MPNYFEFQSPLKTIINLKNHLMITSHYSVKPCQANGLNYTLSNNGKVYQKFLEMRELLCFKLTEWTVPIYKRFFKPKETKWQVELDQLRSYPTGTLGRAWADFYEGQSFGISPNYEEHDICHVLLGYRTSIIEETRMYSFLYGTGKRSAPTILTILIGCIIMPEFINQFYKDYRLGKDSLDFSKWDFRFLLRESLEDLQRMICNKKVREGQVCLF